MGFADWWEVEKCFKGPWDACGKWEQPRTRIVSNGKLIFSNFIGKVLNQIVGNGKGVPLLGKAELFDKKTTINIYIWLWSRWKLGQYLGPEMVQVQPLWKSHCSWLFLCMEFVFELRERPFNTWRGNYYLGVEGVLVPRRWHWFF